MPRVHVIEGPVGAGKSTFAASLAARIDGVHIALDEWFARLFSPDRPGGAFIPWYLERKDRLLELIWDHRVPDHVFDAASNLWEAPDDIEQSELTIEYVSSTIAPLTSN